ncbi:MAG: hypothetical protein R3293_28305, partial [Candidatus Promineifilaceae bacterium]|nr:hypothetical protein [Candidatus Promineifilaceae bacterium]
MSLTVTPLRLLSTRPSGMTQAMLSSTAASSMGVTAISFLTVLMVFLAIGVSSIRKKHKDINDYLTAGYSTPAWIIGL